MPLYIKDDATAALVAQLAQKRGFEAGSRPLGGSGRVGADRGSHPAARADRRLAEEAPLPPPTGQKADKAFFDELSGDL